VSRQAVKQLRLTLGAVLLLSGIVAALSLTSDRDTGRRDWSRSGATTTVDGAHSGEIAPPPQPPRTAAGAEALRTDGSPPTVVHVRTQNVDGEHESTGWVLSAGKGQIVTAFHAVNGDPHPYISAEGIDPDPQSSDVIGATPCRDVALLHMVDGSGLKRLRPAAVQDLRIKDRVRLLGWSSEPGASGWTPSTGRIATLRVGLGPKLIAEARDTAPLMDLIETTARSANGMSGGPLLDQAGRLVGMHVLDYRRSHGARPLSMAIRVDEIAAVLAEFKRARAWGAIGNGLFFPAPESGDGGRRGVVVTGLQTFGSYQNGGVLVTAVNGIPVGNTLASWCAATRRVGAGTARITYWDAPGGRQHTLRTRVNATNPL
jgi:S1-C subfamily serine protease